LRGVCGHAVGIGELGKLLSAFAVLGVNVAMMMTGGSIALAGQRGTSKLRGRPS